MIKRKFNNGLNALNSEHKAFNRRISTTANFFLPGMGLIKIVIRCRKCKKLKKGLSIKLTIWGATLFLAGAIILSGGTYISAGIFLIMIGSIIGILSLFQRNGE